MSHSRNLRTNACIRGYNALFTDHSPEALVRAKHSAASGNYVHIMRLFSTMEKEWPELQKNATKMMRAVRSLDFPITPCVDTGFYPSKLSKEIALVVEQAIWARPKRQPGDYSHSFSQLVSALVSGIFRGINVHEIIWTRCADLIVPACYKHVFPQFYRWEQDASKPDRLLLCPTGDLASCRRFPENKFLICVNNEGPDHPVFNSTYYCLLGCYLAAKHGPAWLMELCQRFGLPLFKFKVDSADEEEDIKERIEDDPIIQKLFVYGDRDVDVIPAPAASSSAPPQKLLLDWADRQCDKLILGQTLTTDVGSSGGSLAQAKVHAGILADEVLGLGELVCDVINEQLIPAIVQMNYGHIDGLPLPEIRCRIPDVGANIKNAQFWRQVLAIPGMKVAQSFVYETLRIPMPDDSEKVFEYSEDADDFVKNDKINSTGSV